MTEEEFALIAQKNRYDLWKTKKNGKEYYGLATFATAFVPNTIVFIGTIEECNQHILGEIEKRKNI